MPNNEDLNADFADITAEELQFNTTPDAPEVEAPFIDPEDDKDNWPVIMIDPEDGKPNYEFLSVSGTKKNGKPFNHDLQVMRGVHVPVPPSIVNMLNVAVSSHFTQIRDPQTGERKMVRDERSSVPWRLIKPGKYF